MKKSMLKICLLVVVLTCGCSNANQNKANDDDVSNNEIVIEDDNTGVSNNEVTTTVVSDNSVSDNKPEEEIQLPRYNEYVNSMKSIETDFEEVQFGSYEQDGVIENGTETIDWYVLAEEDDRVLLISKYALDYQKFNNVNEVVTWETSDLRAWLNDDFYNAAFDESEQTLILDTIVENPDNHWTGAEGGNDTIDKVYILSFDEICEYFTICWQYGGYDDEQMTIMSQEAMCTPTDSVAQILIQEQIDNGATFDYLLPFENWSFEDGRSYSDYGFTDDVLGVIEIGLWCRTPGYENGDFDYSLVHFGLSSSCYCELKRERGIRPVIWVDKSVLE